MDSRESTHRDQCGKGCHDDAMRPKELDNAFVTIRYIYNLREPPEEKSRGGVLANEDLVWGQTPLGREERSPPIYAFAEEVRII